MNNEVVIRQRCRIYGHADSHINDSRGVIRCPMCPDDVCGKAVAATAIPFSPDAAYLADLSNTVGIKPINEMTQSELIDEIMHEQYGALNKFEAERLRGMVAQIRVHKAKARIYSEAGISDWYSWGGGMFGTST